MQPARIAELLRPFFASSEEKGCHSQQVRRTGEEPAVLSPELLQCISMYIDILQRWNARINLTAIRDEEQIVTRHFGESLFAARHLFPSTNREGHGFSRAAGGEDKKPASASEVNRHVAVADLGSGAGFPGIPLKLWAPYINLTLIESNHKKATFLREVVRTLTLTDVNILCARAETLRPGTFSLVTMRAVERFEDILAIAARLLAPVGRLALLIGASQAQLPQRELSDLTWGNALAIPGANARIFLVGSK